ncbi:MAG: hypothetical protein ABDI07_11110 [Candidatus Kryptonium sp.]
MKNDRYGFVVQASSFVIFGLIVEDCLDRITPSIKNLPANPAQLNHKIKFLSFEF